MNMKLIGGPYSGREILDSGAVVIHLALRDGKRLGTATYEPSEDRSKAFWLDNEWLGEIVEEIKAE